jgi:outer membrane protein assembly factor BamB
MLAGDASVRWRHAFGGDGGGTANSSPLSNPLGDRIYRRRFNTATASPVQSIPELSVGPIVGDRCFVLQGGDLIALDILTGGILWRNSDAPKNGIVVSDGHQVAVISDASNQMAFFHFGDGRSLKSESWTGGKLWKATGQHVLCYSSGKAPKTYQIKLLDPFSGEVRLQQESFGINRSSSVRPSGMGRVIDGRFLLWMQSDGQALVWDIVTAQEISRPTLPAYENLIGFNAMRLGDRFLFLPKLKIDRSKKPGDRQVATQSDLTHQTVHAVFAVNRDDGALAWSQEFDQPWGCTLNQSAATPLLMLTRSPTITSVSTTVRAKYLDVLAIGIQDGKKVKERLGKEIESSNNQLQTELIVQPSRNTLLVKVGSDENLTFKFGVDEKDSIDEGKNLIEEYKRELQLRIPQPKP